MRLFLPVRRATLTIPSGPVGDPNREHLHVLLTNPVGAERLILLVSVCSVRAGFPHDPTCYLYPGDHEFIHQQSYVYYARAVIQPEQKIVRGIQAGDFRGQQALDDAIMARICQGLMDSPHTKPSIKTFFQAA
jgi:hypothetical protein